MNVIVIWQSLVVSAYRSFWLHLAHKIDGQLTAVVPHEFWELGGQSVQCQPFSSDWLQKIETHVLKVKAPHIQAVWFQGLGRVFRSFTQKTQGSAESRKPPVLLALMEPYSLSALFVYCLARAFLPKKTKIMFFSLQNIYKDFPLPLRLIQKFLFSRCPQILALSAEVTDVLRKQGYRGDVIRFPLWADAGLFQLLPQEERSELTEPTEPQRRARVGFCGAVTESKGIPDLIEALSLMTPEELAKLHFEVAGGGPLLESLKTTLSTLCERGLTFELHGPVPATQLPQFFNSLDILIVPSRTESHWKEQFGRVIVEAWACGATVIGSNSGEIPVLLEDPDLIFEERNPTALLHTLRNALLKPMTADLRHSIAQRAAPFLDSNTADKLSKTLSLMK